MNGSGRKLFTDYVFDTGGKRGKGELDKIILLSFLFSSFPN